MNGSKKNFVLNTSGMIPKRKPGATSEQEGGHLAGNKKVPNVRKSPQKKGEHTVSSGKLWRKM